MLALLSFRLHGADALPVTPTAAAQPSPLSPAAAVLPAQAQALTPVAEVQAVGTSGKASAVSVSSLAKAYGHSGFLYTLSFSNWVVFNASPLAYTPFEIGYAFSNGLRLQSGLDLFYYEGMDTDEKQPLKGTQKYSYEMEDWRTSLLFSMPVSDQFRPLLGLSLNVVSGSRRLSPDVEGGLDINKDASKISAWGYFGAGALVGAEYLLNPDWSVQLTERYDFTFSATASPSVTQLGLTVLF